jgi:hypothetical protein
MKRQGKFAKAAVLIVLGGLLASVATFARGENDTASTAAVPHLIRFGGMARDLNSKPISGTIGITFLLYKDQEGGVPLWIETQNVQADAKGNYTVQLGVTQPDGLPTNMFASGEARWLGVQLAGKPEEPRVLLLSVPYALKAADAETIGGLPASAFVRADPEGSAVSGAPGSASSGVWNATIGTAGGAAKDGPLANQTVKTPGGQAGYLPMFTSANIVADSSVSQNASGVNINGALNIAFTKSLNGGINATGPVTAPVFEAIDNCCSGPAVSSSVGSGSAINGISSNGIGVSGSAITGTAGVYGVLGSGDPVYSYGVYGENDNTSGGKGVFGTVPYGTEGFGVQGYATGANAIGVAGSTNTFGSIAHQELGYAPIGVIGDSSTGIGIMAASDNGFPLLVENNGTKDAVFVFAQGGGYPIVAQGIAGSYLVLDQYGDLTVTGAIVGAVKSFKIDHPLDPANKYLYHASIESSEMKDLYDGVVLLDGNGSATVKLPDWFEAVNGDFRYQLTAIGAPAPNLHVAQEVSSGQFTIAGGQPGMKISWQVTGVRHDAYARAHPLAVVANKSKAERGYYIHPELYGAPAEKSLAAAHRALVLHHVPK